MIAKRPTLRPKILVLVFSLAVAAYAILGGLLGHALARDSAYRYLSVFQDVVTLIMNNYVEPVSMDSVMEGAIRGMMDALDPDSAYLSPAELEAYRNPPEGQAGIGVEVSKRYYLEVVSVLPGSPAEKAGVEPGDLLKSVDGKNTRELSVIAGAALLRGAPGTNVTLQVLRGRQPEPIEIVVPRARVDPAPVAYKMLTETTGYIHIASLPAGAAEHVARAVRALEAEGARELVLDLRNSFGRIAEEGARVAELFVAGGVAAKLGRRDAERTPLALAADRVIFGGPLVVLTNEHTAGAAEIVASALRHARRGELVGRPTSGRAALQRTIELPDGAGLVLSVSHYWTPEDEPLLGEGLAPTVEIDEASGEGDVGDPILEKGLEILRRPAKKAA